MLSRREAKKVTIYVNEDAKLQHTLLYQAVMAFLLEKRVSGATAIRCLEGFGSHHQIHTPKIEVLAEHLPIRIEFIDAPERVDQILPQLSEMITDGLIVVQDVYIVSSSA